MIPYKWNFQVKEFRDFDFKFWNRRQEISLGNGPNIIREIAMLIVEVSIDYIYIYIYW